jgi:hypothetical protein
MWDAEEKDKMRSSEARNSVLGSATCQAENGVRSQSLCKDSEGPQNSY